MALKGISWIEQNCEKLVVGVFGVGLLGVVAMQFVGVSSQVTLGAGKTGRSVPVEEAVLQVGAEARKINEIISSPEPAELRDIREKLPTDAGVQATFQSKLGSISPRPALASALDEPRYKIIGGGPGSIRDPKGGGTQKFMYAAVNPPAPAKPVGVSYLATIHPSEYLAVPEVQSILPPSPLPKDKASVSVEAVFDGVAFADLLARDPDGEGPLSQLPTHWWAEQNTVVLSVELERQELKPDGTWSEASKVKHMPGRIDLSPQIEKVAASGPEALKSLLDEATAQAADIRHPKYYDILFGEDWVTPSEAITLAAADLAIPDGAAGADDTSKAKKEIAGLDAEMANIRDQMAKIQGPDGRPVPPKTPGPRPDNPGGKGGPIGTIPAPGAKDPKAEKLKGLETRLASLEKRREAAIERWTRRGVVLETEPAVPDPSMPVNPLEKTPVEPALLENPSAKIVAHDVTVERGKTYRYRLSLVFNNPIYGKVVAANPDQEKLTKAPVARGAASEWSDPVGVDAETYYFITSASAQDALSHSSRAGAELYIFRWGYWRKAGLTIEPGDILAAEVKVPDFSKQLAALSDPKLPGGVPAPETAPTPGPKGRPVGPRTERPDRPDSPPGVGKTDETVVYTQVPVSHEAVMLEVAQTAVVTDQALAKSKVENHVFLRDVDGEIVVRNPDGDRGSGLYRKLASSAVKGDEAIKARMAPPVDPNAGAPKGPRGGERPPPPPPPGGGGGGGGGG